MDDTDTNLAALHLFGLITDEQRLLALTHPRSRELRTDVDPAERLIWMVEHDIVDHLDLLSACESADSHVDAALQARRRAILDQACAHWMRTRMCTIQG